MKNVKRILIFTLILMLFSISSVCAGDVNDMAIASDDADRIIEEVNDDTISELDEINEETISCPQEEIIKSTDDGTFTTLQDKINNATSGSTLYLENDYKYDVGFDRDGIKISKSLTINGNGHTIDALSKSRIFYITDNHLDIVLKNIKFCNGNANSLPGGAIFIYGGAMNQCGNVVDCSFVANSANDEDGGAIFGFSNVVNCSFVGNSAKGGISDGGAIYKCDNVVNCSFVGNSAEDCGGAISECGNVVNCNFTNNKAGCAGAINYCRNIVNCSFVGNSAEYGISAICNYKYGNVVNCSFVANR